MINNEQISIVKSTIPLLESKGEQITEHFYSRMFRGNPELQHIFNMSNQRSGRQQVALFQAIVAYAKNIDNLDALKTAVERITNKHASLNIQPEHYAIVGHHLIETLRELVSESFTKEVEDAWTSAYNMLADIFITSEEYVYRDKNRNIGGWRGARKFRLIEKRMESEHVKSFVFEPSDGKAVCHYRPGQYIGIKVNIPGHEFHEIRQYSLSDKPNGESYRISVKRENNISPGVVSNFLHDELRLGDEVELFPPVGDFYFEARKSPTVLISAGVGLTPMQSMLEYLAEEKVNDPILYLHACENADQHSFKKRVQKLTHEIPLSYHTWYRQREEKIEGVHTGFMELSKIENELPLKEGNFYLCGPVVFMQFIKRQLESLGVAASRIHYEVFGPHEAF